MTNLIISDRKSKESNLIYLKDSLSDFVKTTGCETSLALDGSRCVLTIKSSDYYEDIIRAEAIIKVAEIIAINYKYDFFKDYVKIGGLSSVETEILFTGLIAADLDEDKRYTYEKTKDLEEIAIDGIFNFRLLPLRKKWQDVAEYIPTSFINSQLREFVSFLIENRRKTIYVENGLVYDGHYRRLKRSDLIPDSNVKLLKEVLLSNSGEIRLSGSLPKEDERFLREYYSDRIYFSNGYYN